ncbi:hypothetical protein [Paenibacillus polymyxa]|uniref:hypothetical protein n=1 Tax=Paenibacillus polymyxa TaxID=1406 RepID=UPI000737AF7F|nr:hypothetical protein [Paenibacillus polymyxa]
MNKPTPDYIRDTAVSILQDYDMGIKQSDLWREVETFLSESGYEITDHTLKNALWDLEKQRPEEVLKIKKSAKNVELHPLDNNSDKQDAYDEAWNESLQDRAIGSLINLSGMVSEITVRIDSSGIHSKLDETQVLYMNEYPPEVIEAITTLGIALDLMEKSKSAFKNIRHVWALDSRKASLQRR